MNYDSTVDLTTLVLRRGDEGAKCHRLDASTAVYFRDPDGHLIEHITMLDKEPRPDLGVVSWSEWLVQSKLSF